MGSDLTPHLRRAPCTHPLPKPEWVKLFKQTFRFTGGEIVGEFLLSTGYLPGAHEPGCPAYKRILKLNPPWKRAL